MNFHPIIRPFEPSDQSAAQTLIEAGMVEHWGVLDETVNPDIKDIAHSYRDGVFLVMLDGERLIGTGAYQPRENKTLEIVRMSIAGSHRRLGLGWKILDALCKNGHDQGYTRAILETNADWRGVVSFYKRYGFKETHRVAGEWGEEIYFELTLGNVMANG